jgi:hypothetical protein
MSRSLIYRDIPGKRQVVVVVVGVVGVEGVEITAIMPSHTAILRPPVNIPIKELPFKKFTMFYLFPRIPDYTSLKNLLKQRWKNAG